MEVKERFGTGVAVPEPVGCGEMPVARHGVLKDFR
jgi:hypothetical protein